MVLIFLKYFFKINEIKTGIKKICATGTNTSEKVIDEEPFNIIGIKNGRRKAIMKFVIKIEITVNSIFPFNRFMIIGEAIAVGAIPVINAIWASCEFPDSYNIK